MSKLHASRGAVEFPSAFSYFSCHTHVVLLPCILCLFCLTMLEGVAIFGPCTHVTHSAGEPDDGVRLTLLLANWIL